ncbi:MarR family winged helix-turn-helix transcriptional regulator [Embleya scabrispora]|uniref:MarR family winged helix-turn-helix transcriptional regulator n=1 Tax=Embleya scabrispora TaxID=159449 RepID=UPI00036AE52F|nr:MarR family transcriptional regulator [Embleya scabrispora]MYS80902.1 MarR family transcriptional regulator [Streptomyces sp. SID5474]
MSEPRWLDDLEMAAWQGFVEAGHRVDRALERQLKDEAGLSHPQYEILVHLSGAPDGELRMAELAEKLITSKSGITYQVAQLEKLGLVRRRACPDQPRGVFAVLTEQGAIRLRGAAPAHVERVREVLIDVLDREQLAVLAEALGMVGRRLRAHDRA